MGWDNTATALTRIARERDKQDSKWGEQNHDDQTWGNILTEEYLEAIRDLNDGKYDSLEEEIIQTAAVCVAWLESRWRRQS